MKPNFLSEFSIVDAAIRRKDLGYFALSHDATKNSNFFGFGQWKPGEPLKNVGQMNELLATLVIATKPLEQFVAIGQRGSVLCTGNGDTHFEKIGDETFGPRSLGPLRGARTIENSILAVGMRRQIYLRDESGAWKRFDQGIEPTKEVTGFETIHGRSLDDIYAAGWDGEIWHFQGGSWRRHESPTPRILTDICFSDDATYICGQAGTLLVKKTDHFESVEFPKFKFNIWGAAWFHGALYLSTFSGIFKYDGSRLEFIDLAESLDVTSFYKLRCHDGVLWSFGAKDVVAFDGQTWTTILSPTIEVRA